MTLREREDLMRSAAQGRKQVVIVDNAGQTYRGAAREFADWYQTESGYAALSFAGDGGQACRLESREILYIELSR